MTRICYAAIALVVVAVLSAVPAAACSVDWGCYTWSPGYQVCAGNAQTYKNLCYSGISSTCQQECCPQGEPECGDWSACEFACRVDEESACDSSYCGDLDTCYSNHCYFNFGPQSWGLALR